MEDKIDGFEWYLHRAFKDSIAECKFQQGDVIYRHKPQGKNWGEEIRHIEFLVQVKSPTRTYTNANGDLGVFNSNWSSKVVFEKIYPNNHSLNEIIETTQGKLLTYFWKNDEAILHDEKLLLPILTNISAKQINSNFIKSKIPIGWIGFAYIIDSVSNLSLSKRNTIHEVLTNYNNFRTESHSLEEAFTPNISQSKSYSGICPTLSVELCLMQTDNLDNIHESLKSVLYKGDKNRFSINAHGQLFKN